MFGDSRTMAERYPARPLGEVADIGSGVTKGRKLDDADTVEVPYLRVANVQDGHLDLSEMKTIPIRETERDKYGLRPGDIVMTEGGDADKLGRGAIWTGALPYCAHQNHVFRVRPHDGVVLNPFLKELIGSHYGKAYFLSVAKQTTGIASINKTQLSAFPVPLPSLLEQQRFANLAASAMSSEALADTAARTSADLAAALTSRLFGEAA
jgi:type I restriction enzyme S subunit